MNRLGSVPDQCLVAIYTIVYWWCEDLHCFLLVVVGFNPFG